MSESNSNVSVRFNTTEEVITVGEVSATQVEDKKVLEIKTDLKAIGIIANVKPEPNSFLIKIEQMVNYIKSTIGNEKINATNIVIISTNLMLIVEQYKDLTGYQKKC